MKGCIARRSGLKEHGAGCADPDFDGEFTPTDYTTWIIAYNQTAGSTGGRGTLSAWLDNEIGYAGYRVSAGEGGELWHARFRDYSPQLGTWTRRDPAGYVDGMGLYQYAGSRPIEAIDPMGLYCSPCGCGTSCGGGDRGGQGKTRGLDSSKSYYDSTVYSTIRRILGKHCWPPDTPESVRQQLDCDSYMHPLSSKSCHE